MSLVAYDPVVSLPPSARTRSDRLVQKIIPYVLLLLLCGILFLPGLATGELYKTESLRALIAAEFLRSGSWIVPTLYGEPLLTKPPGMYAAIALASLPLGSVQAWSARLPSALAATLTVFLGYATFRRYLDRRAGLVAALILPLSIMWLERVPSAEIDMVQVAWVTAALLFFVRALEEAEGNRRAQLERAWWQAALLCVAGGFLTKWTAPAFFYLTVVPLLWWRGRLRLLWSWAHLLSASLAALPCVGWGLMVAILVGWDPLYETVRREALQHLSPAHHSRPYPWDELLTFPLVFLLTNLPWSAFALGTLNTRFRTLWDQGGQRLLQTLHCWTWANLLFWTLVPGHRPRHGMPLQPGLAGLAAFVWIAWMSGKVRWPIRRVRPGTVLLGILAAWLVIKLTFVSAIIPARDPRREPRAKGELLSTLVAEHATLYLFQVKDEGILFYYGRPARRLPSPEQLPRQAEPVYCLLTEAEWRGWPTDRPAEVLGRLRDEQGEPIVAVKVP
jgi:4-amino-4-deoxy-L-arabinose transferase-like glycosyltransferase